MLSFLVYAWIVQSKIDNFKPHRLHGEWIFKPKVLKLGAWTPIFRLDIVGNPLSIEKTYIRLFWDIDPQCVLFFIIFTRIRFKQIFQRTFDPKWLKIRQKIICARLRLPLWAKNYNFQQNFFLSKMKYFHYFW
jgi:hypothetical protein